MSHSRTASVSAPLVWPVVCYGPGAVDAARVIPYHAGMTPPSDDPDPYRAPEAPLELPAKQLNAVISDQAMQLLAGTRWGMIAVAVALMANGALMLIGGAFALAYIPAAAPKPLIIALLVIFALVMFLPGLRLMQSALAITRARHTRAEGDITAALQRHLQFWMLFGCMILFMAALFYFLFGFLRVLR